MALEDVIAKRYHGYITIEDLVTMIAREYACSDSDALLVLAEAISKKTVSDPHSFNQSYPLSLYFRERLGPKKSSYPDDTLKALIRSKGDTQEELDDIIPF
jgi:hypothetical protein